MKNLFYFFLIFLTGMTISCSSESVGDLTPEDSGVTDDDEIVVDVDQPENVIKTPCTFDLSGVTAESTIVIDCLLDLEGKTVNLPANVTFDFKGGDIINGKLVFSGGKIDGRLLSSKLEVTGDVELKDPTFKFYAVRWDLVEGRVSTEQAQENNFILEGAFNMVKRLKGNTFEINKLNAFFEINKVAQNTANNNFYPTVESVNLPSDFTLKMTDNTYLRVQPTRSFENGPGNLLGFREVSNVTVIGGNLIGDRDEHDYSDQTGEGEEGNHLIRIQSADHIVIDGVKMIDGSIGGIDINSLGFAFQPEYDPTNNIIIKNCHFENIRRTSLVITDGRQILIENNTFIKSGQPTERSSGSLVGYAINIEAERFRDPVSGELRYYERAFDITIRNNVERESRIGGVTVTIGENVIIEGNDMENKIVYSTTNNSKIINNTFTASEESGQSPAIIAGGRGETVFSNEISGNKINGYGLAIAAYYDDMKIFGNEITNCQSGIQLKEVTNTKIYNNTITNTSGSGRGISAQLTHVNNTNIYENTIDVGTNHIYFVELNQGTGEENFNVNVERNRFLSSPSSVMSRTNGVVFRDNNTQGGVQVINASKINIASNTISPAQSHGIHLKEANSGISISNNQISTSSSFECIKDDSTSAPTASGNTCSAR